VIVAEEVEEDDLAAVASSCWFCCSNPRINGSDLRPVTVEIVC